MNERNGAPSSAHRCAASSSTKSNISFSRCARRNVDCCWMGGLMKFIYCWLWLGTSPLAQAAFHSTNFISFISAPFAHSILINKEETSNPHSFSFFIDEMKELVELECSWSWAGEINHNQLPRLSKLKVLMERATNNSLQLHCFLQIKNKMNFLFNLIPAIRFVNWWERIKKYYNSNLTSV